MKTLLILLLLCVFVSGCGVTMNRAYKAELDKQVVLVDITYNQARNVNLTEEQFLDLTQRFYVTLRMWQDAQTLRGVPTDRAEKEAYLRGIMQELNHE